MKCPVILDQTVSFGLIFFSFKFFIFFSFPFAEVLCRTLAVGICGSDIHYWRDGKVGTFILGNEPFVLGHETAAEIVRCGKNVLHLKPGDRVAVEPTVSCGDCDYCLNDQYNLCPQITCHATPPIDGTLQHYFIHSAKYCFKYDSFNFKKNFEFN